MPKFNTLLREAGLDPKQVRLVRHKDTRKHARRTTTYALWMRDVLAFEDYQSLQSGEVFGDEPCMLASFVVSPNDETLFVGMHEVRSIQRNQTPVQCPLSLTQFAPDTRFVYDIARLPHLGELSGLMTVDWGDGYRAWVQFAHRQDKPVVEIRRQREDPPFPSFPAFRSQTDELDVLPVTWKAVLSATGGIYLLVSMENGEQYVGSATGQEGFWSRWQAYARDGHGGNVLLRKRGKPPYAIIVLETASSSASRTDIIEAERRWKDRLGSRAFGLNGN